MKKDHSKQRKQLVEMLKKKKKKSTMFEKSKRNIVEWEMGKLAKISQTLQEPDHLNQKSTSRFIKMIVIGDLKED